jgi:hypothetical protein
MSDLKISELITLSDNLQEKMKGIWRPLNPENGHYKLLWIFEELGEIVAILKKRGSNAIMEAYIKKHEKNMRRDFVTEHGNYLSDDGSNAPKL